MVKEEKTYLIKTVSMSKIEFYPSVDSKYLIDNENEAH